MLKLQLEGQAYCKRPPLAARDRATESGGGGAPVLLGLLCAYHVICHRFIFALLCLTEFPIHDASPPPIRTTKRRQTYTLLDNPELFGEVCLQPRLTQTADHQLTTSRLPDGWALGTEK
jgi:hypothetical protein